MGDCTKRGCQPVILRKEHRPRPLRSFRLGSSGAGTHMQLRTSMRTPASATGLSNLLCSCQGFRLAWSEQQACTCFASIASEHSTLHGMGAPKPLRFPIRHKCPTGYLHA
jgi:hypothetical protein